MDGQTGAAAGNVPAQQQGNTANATSNNANNNNSGGGGGGTWGDEIDFDLNNDLASNGYMK